MRTRTLGILALVTLLIVIGAVLTSERGTYAPREAEPERLFPGLAESLNSVAEIDITSGDESITLAKRDGAWVDASRGGYPVRFEPVKQLLVTLSEAEVLDHKTSDPANFARLGVADPSAESEPGPGGPGDPATVTLRDASGKALASAVLGKVRQLGDARFVRRTSDDEVLLVEGRLVVQARAAGWLDREIMRIERDAFDNVTIVRPDGEEFTIRRAPEGAPALELLDIPAGRELNSQSLLSRVAYALAYVDLEDVRPETELDIERLPPPLLASYATTGGIEIDVSVWNEQNVKWTVFKVVPPQGEDASPEAIERAEWLRATVEGWAYKLGPSVTLAWDTTMSQLTRPIPEPEPAGPETP